MTTSQDFDRLSAYIDNQLPQAEKAGLEARLAAEPELREALRDLRLTVSALRSLPAVRPPRSFTLTPAMVGAERARRPLFPTLRLATALSALALTLVVAGDIGSGLLAARPVLITGETQTMATAPDEATTPVEAPAADLFATETPAADRMVESMSAEAAGTGTASVEANGAEGAGTDSAAPEATPSTSLMAPLGTPTAEAPGELLLSATPGPTAKLLPDATPTPLAVAEAQGEETLPYDPGADGAGGAVTTQQPGGLSALRTLELGLAMLTVLFGLGAWLARRNA
jgi:hypothetical protein